MCLSLVITSIQLFLISYHASGYVVLQNYQFIQPGKEFSSPEGRRKLLNEYAGSAEAGEPWLIPAEQFSVEQVKPLSKPFFRSCRLFQIIGNIRQYHPIACPLRDYKVLIAGTEYDPEDVLHFTLNPSDYYSWKGTGYRVVFRLNSFLTRISPLSVFCIK